MAEQLFQAGEAGMELPADTSLPFFAYGALQPTMPAFRWVRQYLASEPVPEEVRGELFARDGLPLLHLNGALPVQGCLIRWCEDVAPDAYAAVCRFEPRKHYIWTVAQLESGVTVNLLVDRYPNKGNPQPLDNPSRWRMGDDPAFGEGLATVAESLAELSQTENHWRRFFKAQMAYLLLWSILERLSALCVGPAKEPTSRVNELYALPGMDNLIAKHVDRTDAVADARDPTKSYRLDKAVPKKCFQYYYQVRSNLSHRGKGVFNELDKVERSAHELLAITREYLSALEAA